GRKRLYQYDVGYQDREPPLAGLGLFFTWGGRRLPPASGSAGVRAPLALRSAAERSPELLVERDAVTEAEPAHRRAAVRDDIVRPLQHAQLVAREERGRDPLEQCGRAPREPERHVDGRPPGAERRLEAPPEITPRHRIRAAELDRAVRSFARDSEPYA